jgi:mono/diheme cytochrome c family protein
MDGSEKRVAGDMGRRPGGSSGLSFVAIAVAGFALFACDQKSDADTAHEVSEKSTAPAPAASDSGGGGDSNDLTRFDGNPYKVYPDGKVDFATWRGSNLYAGMCLRCHGENGEGSSFAPSLTDALKTVTYYKFIDVVTNGITVIDSGSTEVMPSFGDNRTIMKYVDSIYAYLKGLSDGALPPGDLNWQGPRNE